MNQTAPTIEGMGMSEDSEYAPAIALKVEKLDIDDAKSSLNITGNAQDWVLNKIANLFKDKIFNMVIGEFKSHIENQLTDDINKYLFNFGSHYEVDGFGFDYSLLQQPLITDDNLLTIS